MKYTAAQFPELVVRKWLQATEKKQIAIETWLKNANRGCKANVSTIQGRCTRVTSCRAEINYGNFTFVRGKAVFPESREMF